MSDSNKVTQILVNQSNVVHQLFLLIADRKPQLWDGLFCISNKEAFDIAEQVITRQLTNLNSSMVILLNQAVQDILRVTESFDVEGLDENSLKSIEELELPIAELLDMIENYDKKASDWNYSLEDMRRPDFIGIFCMDCDAEIGGEDNCPDCSI